MKKKLVFILLLCVFSLNMAAENIESEEPYLIDKIPEIELKKKEFLDEFYQLKESADLIKSEKAKEAAKKIFDKKIELNNKVFRKAELCEDGTPAPFVGSVRKDIFDDYKAKTINEYSEMLKQDPAFVSIKNLKDEVNKLFNSDDYYEYKRPSRTVSTKDELEVSYGKYTIEKNNNYDSSYRCGWNVYISLKNKDIDFSITKFLPVAERDYYSNDDLEKSYEEFYDNIEYYDELIKSGNSPYVFYLTYELTSSYDFVVTNLSFNDSLNENSYKKYVDIYYDESHIDGSISSSYALDVISDYCNSYIGNDYYDYDSRSYFNDSFVNQIYSNFDNLQIKAMGFSPEPVIMPAGTDGTYGTKGTYVLFGLWPQTAKSDDVVINEAVTFDLLGRICYKGSDNCYYVNEEIKSASEDEDKTEECYFKLEPVKWRVLTNNYDGSCLLLAENILGSCYLEGKDKELPDFYNNYSNSSARKFLNGEFFNKAFSYDNKKKIITVSLNNSAETTTDTGNNIKKAEQQACENTEDRIFLLSEQEITNNKYGFNKYNINDKSRRRKATDYGKALGIFAEDSGSYKDNGNWWLRSPSCDHSYYYVSSDGKADKYRYSYDYGLVPAISVMLDDLLPENVSDLKTATTNTKVIFSWTNPDNDNFEKVLISMKGFKDIEVKDGKGAHVTKSLSGLKTGRSYNFTIKTVDKNGNVSRGIKVDTVIKDIAPEAVTNLKAVPGNGMVELSWTNPENIDLEKILISGFNSKDVSIKAVPCENKKLEIKNLTNGKEYNITIKAVDQGGNTSESCSVKFIPYEYTTSKPVILPEGTDGSIGTEGTYVLFGDWPQTIKASDVVIDTSATENINGWTCYKGSDNCYYVKAAAKPYDYYDYTFSNGERVRENNDYYFKMEPIKWRVIYDEYDGGKLLLSEKALTAKCFYSDDYYRSDFYDNNYEYSTIRAYLNGLDGTEYDVEDFTDKGFLNMAFTEDAFNLINTVIVDNSADTTTDSEYNIDKSYDAVCEDTEDKIFLLSENDVTTEEYGFERYSYYDYARKIGITDYSIAMGISFNSWDSIRNCDWWLRSPRYHTYVFYVDKDGTADDDYSCTKESVGVVPSLSVSFE